jgi:hypothetical protein
MQEIIGANREGISPWFVQTAAQVSSLAGLEHSYRNEPHAFELELELGVETEAVYGNASVMNGKINEAFVDDENDVDYEPVSIEHIYVNATPFGRPNPTFAIDEPAAPASATASRYVNVVLPASMPAASVGRPALKPKPTAVVRPLGSNVRHAAPADQPAPQATKAVHDAVASAWRSPVKRPAELPSRVDVIGRTGVEASKVKQLIGHFDKRLSNTEG